MQSVEFIIPDKPIAWKRVDNRKGRFYDGQAKVKQQVRDYVLSNLKQVNKLTGPLFLQVVFYFEMPKSWSKKKKDKMRLKYHDVKPDKSNVIKFLEDTFNEIFYKDDCQIAREVSSKLWDDTARTVVRLSELEPI